MIARTFSLGTYTLYMKLLQPFLVEGEGSGVLCKDSIRSVTCALWEVDRDILDQGLANSFWKGRDSKYFQLCVPSILCCRCKSRCESTRKYVRE